MTTYADTETRSTAPIERGTDVYTASAECTLVTFARDEDKPDYWDVLGGQLIPAPLVDAYRDPDETFVFHNAQFDRMVFARCLKMPFPITRLRCTMAQAYAHGMPGSLEFLGMVLGLPMDERKLAEDGKRLMRLFCLPRHDDTFNSPDDYPADWQQFIEYAVRDTVALREIAKRLPKHNFQGVNLESWWIDQLINEYGFCTDQKLASAARKLLTKAKDLHDTQISDATLGLVSTANQRAKLLRYFESQGVLVPNLQAATMRTMLEADDLAPEIRFLLELRLEAAKSSGAKFKRLMEWEGEASRVRFAIQWSGAGRTGRSSGRGPQPHNFTRPTMKADYIESVVLPGVMSGAALGEPLLYGGPNEACSNVLRPCITAGPGNELVVADWSNIEGRINAWIAGETWKLDAYRAQDAGTGKDGYKLLYARFFGIDVDEVDDHMRQMGKVIDLSCGYGGSVGAFVTMAAGYDMDLDAAAPAVLAAATEAQKAKAYRKWRRAFLNGEDYLLEPRTFQACAVLVDAYRTANSAINDLRHALDYAVKECVRYPNHAHSVGKCRIWSTGSWLVIELPSGRRLLYAQPKIETERKWDVESNEWMEYDYITYITARGKSWRRERAWSGLFLENIVQAIANDVLRAAQRLIQHEWDAEFHTTPMCLHVHDEIALDVPKGTYPLGKLRAQMTTGILAANPWLAGLPLAAAGYVGHRFRKG